MKELSKKTGNYFKKRNKCQLSYRHRSLSLSLFGERTPHSNRFLKILSSDVSEVEKGRGERFIFLRLCMMGKDKREMEENARSICAQRQLRIRPSKLNFSSYILEDSYFQKWLIARCMYVWLENNAFPTKKNLLCPFFTNSAIFFIRVRKRFFERERIKELLKRFRCSRTFETRNKSR